MCLKQVAWRVGVMVVLGIYRHSEYSEIFWGTQIFCWYSPMPMLGAKSVELCYCVGMNGQTVCGCGVRGNLEGYWINNRYRLFHASNEYFHYFICLENPPLVCLLLWRNNSLSNTTPGETLEHTACTKAWKKNSAAALSQTIQTSGGPYKIILAAYPM